MASPGGTGGQGMLGLDSFLKLPSDLVPGLWDLGHRGTAGPGTRWLWILEAESDSRAHFSS